MRFFYIFVISFFIISLQSCGHRFGDKSSSSIAQSQEIGTYICKFIPSNVMINDSIQFNITNVFAEKRYRQLNNDRFLINYTIDKTKSQLVLYIEPSWWELSDSNGYRKTWKFSNMHSVRKHTWVIDIDAPIPPDTVYVEVIRRHIDSTGGAGVHYGEKLGEFIIVKSIVDK